LNEFVLQIAIIFVPGIIWARIDAYYASRRSPDQFNFLINSLIFGLISYSVLFAVYWCLGQEFSLLGLGGGTGVANTSFFDEILFSVPVSLVGATVWCYATRYRFLMNFLNVIGASKAFGDEDVWEFTFNSDDKESRYANVRDRKHGLVHSGFVYSFSGTDKKRELVLVRAITYDDVTGDELYRSPRLYLEWQDGWLAIEFPTGLEE